MEKLAEWTSDDIKYMKEALKQAEKARRIEEVPIGCVIVYQGRIIGRGYNRRNIQASALAHAEILAIKKASKKIGDWRLEECIMYVTLEPCQMWFKHQVETVRGVLLEECQTVMKEFFKSLREKNIG